MVSFIATTGSHLAAFSDLSATRQLPNKGSRYFEYTLRLKKFHSARLKEFKKVGNLVTF